MSTTQVEHRLNGLLENVSAPAGDVITEAIAEIERLRAAGGYWDGFDAALAAVEEGQRLYGTTRKAVAALREASRLGRGITEHDLATKAEAVSGE